MSRQSTHKCGKVVIPTLQPPLPLSQEIFLVRISVGGLGGGRITSMKPPGIETATVRPVEQRLIQLRQGLYRFFPFKEHTIKALL